MALSTLKGIRLSGHPLLFFFFDHSNGCMNDGLLIDAAHLLELVLRPMGNKPVRYSQALYVHVADALICEKLKHRAAKTAFEYMIFNGDKAGYALRDIQEQLAVERLRKS